MRWEDERYVRLYTRDTLDWDSLSFEAQGLLALLLRKFDRAGILHLGKHGKRGVAAAVGHAHRWATLEPALEELLADGCMAIRGEDLLMRNFIGAQEAQASDRARQMAKRERDRDKVAAQGMGHLSDAAKDQVAALGRASEPGSVTHGVTRPQPAVTPERHAGAVTQERHAGSVTLSCAVPAVPSVPAEPAGRPQQPPPPLPPPDQRVTGKELRELWNQAAAPPARLPRWQEFPPAQELRADLVALEYDRRTWQSFFATARRSAFLNGFGPKGFLLKPGVLLKEPKHWVTGALNGEYSGPSDLAEAQAPPVGACIAGCSRPVERDGLCAAHLAQLQGAAERRGLDWEKSVRTPSRVLELLGMQEASP